MKKVQITETVLRDANQSLMATRLPYSDFADILPAGGGKPNGLAEMLKHFGWTKDEAIAFGDGGNDVAMLQYAGLGVAMGNACDAAKAAADYVTADIDKDGIAKALQHFGLL